MGDLDSREAAKARRKQVFEALIARAEGLDWLDSKGRLKPSKASNAFDFLVGAATLEKMAGFEFRGISEGLLFILQVRDVVAEARLELAKMQDGSE